MGSRCSHGSVRFQEPGFRRLQYELRKSKTASDHTCRSRALPSLATFVRVDVAGACWLWLLQLVPDGTRWQHKLNWCESLNSYEAHTEGVFTSYRFLITKGPETFLQDLRCCCLHFMLLRSDMRVGSERTRSPLQAHSGRSVHTSTAHFFAEGTFPVQETVLT